MKVYQSVTIGHFVCAGQVSACATAASEDRRAGLCDGYVPVCDGICDGSGFRKYLINSICDSVTARGQGAEGRKGFHGASADSRKAED